MQIALLALLPLLAAAAPVTDQSVKAKRGEPAHIPLSSKARPAQTLSREDVLHSLKFRHGSSNIASNGSNVPIINRFLDKEYTAWVEIGTPPQRANLIIDTGSNLLWAFGSKCQAEFCKQEDFLFDESKSSTWTQTGNVSSKYGIGETAGDLGSETVSWGGFTATNVTFGVISDAKDFDMMGAEKVHGIIGMGIAPPNATQIPWHILAGEQWPDKQFGMYLGRNGTTPDMFGGGLPGVANVTKNNSAIGGRLTLGGVDHSLFDGELNYIDVVSHPTDRHWNIPLEGIKWDNKTIGGTNGEIATLDSGTTVALVPSDVYKQIWKDIPSAIDGVPPFFQPGTKLYNCNETIHHQLSFRFGGVDYPISDDDLWYARFISPKPGESDLCVGAIADLQRIIRPGMLPNNSYLLGDTFLKNVYTAHKFSNPPQIGLGKLKAGL